MKLRGKDIQKAYDDGQDAYRQKLSSELNPYGEKDQRYYAWLDGYLDEMRMDRGNNMVEKRK